MGIDFSLLAVPEQDRRWLAVPSLRDYPAIIAANRGLNAGLAIGGESLHDFRRAARQEAWLSARERAVFLGLDTGPAPSPDAPVIASGHQPLAFHPGVMIKIAALTQASRSAGASALFITVDSDEYRAETAHIPVIQEGRLRKMEYPLFPNRRRGLYETAEAEPAEDMLSRMEAMARFMDDPRLAGPRTALEEFGRKLLNARLDFPDYVSRAVAMRRAWLAPEIDGFMEAPVSILAGGACFLKFAEHILSDIGGFAPCYNQALDEYRKARKLRYPANPFPNLEASGGAIQAPFWALGPAGREKLYVLHSSGVAKSLRTESGLEFGLGAVADGALAIRPKAITLSLYMRLVLCDLFIHGVGGAKYDHVTDRLIETYFNANAPDYACVSATLWPGVEALDPRPRMEKIERLIREIGQHPEIAGAGDPRIAPLAAEKMTLVDKIKAPGADKKSVGSRISELNELMAGLMKEKRLILERELKELEPLEKVRQAAQERDYPYFLYSKRDFLALASGLAQPSAK